MFELGNTTVAHGSINRNCQLFVVWDHNECFTLLGAIICDQQGSTKDVFEMHQLHCWKRANCTIETAKHYAQNIMVNALLTPDPVGSIVQEVKQNATV